MTTTTPLTAQFLIDHKVNPNVLTTNALTAINASPTLTQLFEDAITAGVQFTLNKAGDGSYYSTDTKGVKTIVVDPNNLTNPAQFASLMSHELGHWKFEQINGAQPSSTDFQAFITYMNNTEAFGDATNAQYMKEAATNNVTGVFFGSMPLSNDLQTIGANYGATPLESWSQNMGNSAEAVASNYHWFFRPSLLIATHQRSDFS